MARTASTRSAKSAPAKRGRPAKEEVKAKRGRPAKAAPAKRGRPAKAAAVKRGRPAKAAPAKRAKKSKEIAGLQRVQVTATTIATFRAYLHEVTNDTIVYSLKKPNSSRVYRHVMPITSVVAVQGAPGGFAVLTLRMPVSLMAFDSVSYQAVDGFLSFTTTDDTVVTVRSDDEDVHVGISELEEDASYLEEDEVEVEVEGDDEEGLDEDEAFDDEEAAGDDGDDGDEDFEDDEDEEELDGEDDDTDEDWGEDEDEEGLEEDADDSDELEEDDGEDEDEPVAPRKKVRPQPGRLVRKPGRR